jgi:RNA polymerase sigma-70 factor (ECF subfamily)
MRMELVGQHAHPLRGERVNGQDDQARFARVVLPHLADAYALARWLTGDGTDAEDVVQDACLRAFRGIAGFRERDARAWVLTIVHHTADSWLGKNRPATLVVTDDVEGIEGAETAGGDAEAETEMIAKADAVRLQAAI